jgi:hypothetical protein
MTARHRLPNRRFREGFDLRHGNVDYHVCVGRDFDGRSGSGDIRELFLSTRKLTGTDTDALARDAGLLFSLLVQHGCPIATILDALTRDNQGRPAGVLGRAIEIAVNSGKPEPQCAAAEPTPLRPLTPAAAALSAEEVLPC